MNSNNTRKRSHEDGHEIDVDNESFKQMLHEKETLKGKLFLVIWQRLLKVSQQTIKYENDSLVSSNTY